MRKHRTPQDLLDNVKAILPIIKQGAEASEQLGRLQDEVLNALFEQRLFRLFIPERYNGEPTDLPTALRAFELISSADGATGWLAMIGAGGGLFSGFLEESAASEIFSPERAVIAGSGMPSGVATKNQDDGYDVSGRWSYASGSHHATWFTANCLIDGTDNEITAVAVPADQVAIHDTWDVFGMKATGSHDFSVESVPVKHAFTFSLFKEPVLDDPIFRCPLEVLASLTFASVAVGIAQHALDEFNEFAQHKQPFGSSSPLAENEGIKQRCDKANQLISNSRDELYRLAEQVWAQLENGEALEEALRQQVQQAGVDIVRDCVEAANLLKARAGMMAVFNSSAFGRAWRDLHILSQHVMLAPSE
ncbi:acyl-CoA dehydrogenase family protein [Thiomicrorhabdus sp. ZW0627]|uniref:acyl-CoA dehydrogenase family protein n=1 Tax=Thiomicrorhabdus sp. ZW0627 TaxID=3039774 RepID=UPI0024366A27|nr:acyl-CoA dehydrogenase family protein [Thiomicrorhabdus sp. ZW0627]MDG6774508.1 acyl-CoA dehydrogenase family protein [Thiomicrorhabdus sp. ZW0627]